MKKAERPGKKSIILSIGGNVIIRRNEPGTVEEQFENIRASFECVECLIENSRSLVITHGNGPIVGNILIRNESAKGTLPQMPLYVCDADSEGGVGFMLQQTLYNEFKVITYLGEWFGAPDRIRLSYALDIKQMEEGLGRIKQAMQKIKVI